MKKRSLKLLVLLAVIYAAASSFVSCKDNYSDDMASIHYQLATLGEAVSQQEQILGQMSRDLESYKESVRLEITNIWNVIDELKGHTCKCDTAKMNAQLRELFARVAALETEYSQLDQSIRMINDTLAKHRNDINDLGAKYNSLNITLNEVLGRLTIIEGNVKYVNGRVDSLGNVVIDFRTNINNRVDSVGNVVVNINNILNGRVDSLGNIVVKYNDAVNGRVDSLGRIVTYYNTVLNTRIDSLANLMPGINTRIDALRDSVAKVKGVADLALEYAEKHEQAITQLEQKFNDYYTKSEIDVMLTNVRADITKAQKTADEAKSLAQDAYTLAGNAMTKATEALEKANANELKISNLETALNNAVNELKGEVSALDTRLTTVEGKVSQLISDLNILQSVVDNIKNDIAKMIVGVTYQGIVNPVIGQFSMPVGLENNMLFAWFGQNTTGDQPKWPNNYLDASDIQMIGSHETFRIEAGDIFVTDMDNGKAYLGRVYTTINPNTVDFSGQNLKIVDSQDNECGAYLEPLKSSNELLQFGFTRDAKNGFYEADAWIDVADVEKIRATKTLDKTQLKNAAANVLAKIKAKMNGTHEKLDIANIYKAFMDNATCVIPQYGLKASWTDSDNKEHSLYSKYGLAVTSIKPASFTFLQDYKAPLIPKVSDISYDVDFKLDSISYDPIMAPTLSVKVYIVYLSSVVIGVYSNKADAEQCIALNPGSTYIEQTFSIADFQKFIDNINNNIVNKLTTDVNTLIHEITIQTQSNVNKALGKVNTQIVKRINDFIDKINNRLSNLNYYLQPTILYNTIRLKGGKEYTEWHPLSNDWRVPSPVNTPIGGGYVRIEPTTNTAESLCPCYRKFVAVTNVFTEDYSTSAKSGNAACKAALDAANAPAPAELASLGVHNMKSVYYDNQDVVFKMTDGYVYEITYVALDYSGKTRVHKCYMKAHVW